MTGSITWETVGGFLFVCGFLFTIYKFVQSRIDREISASKADRQQLRDRLESSRSELNTKIEAMRIEAMSRVDAMRIDLVQNYVASTRMEKIEAQLAAMSAEIHKIDMSLVRIEAHQNGK